MIHLRTIDAHAAGEPLRLIIEGFPSPRGRTMLEKREWVKKHADHVRRALMLEPRGHADMYGAILTEPVSPGSHAGVLFMHNEGYSTMCGHGIIAVTTMALERGLLMPGGDGTAVVYDSPAGTIRARATLGAGTGEAGGAGPAGHTEPAGARVESVAFLNVPSGEACQINPRSIAIVVTAMMPWPHIVLQPSLCMNSRPAWASRLTGSVSSAPYMSACPRGSSMSARRR